MMDGITWLVGILFPPTISWLDVISFLLAIFTAIMTYRVESRQDRYLKDIRKHEMELEKKVDEVKEKP